MSGGEPANEDGAAGRLPRVMSIVAVTLFVALLAYGVLSQGSDKRIDASLANGEAALAPEFELSVLSEGSLPANLNRDLRAQLADGRLGLAELDGTPFVLNFWAAWCNPCREEAPILERGWRRHGPAGVLYLGLDMQDATEDALAFLREFGITYPTIRDPTNEIARSYGATGIPETYFVSAEGRVVGHVIGVVSEDQLDEGALAAKRGQIVGTLTGGARRLER